MAKRVILVDGSSLIYRAYYAIPGNFQTAAGLHTNAIYGFATMFRKLMSGRKPDYGAVVFDAPGATFREARYAAYKAQRPRMEDDLREQLPWIDKVVIAHNYPLLREVGFEADDIIGTLTKQAVSAGMEVFIVSADKDFAQLIDGSVRMLDTLRDISYDPELVRKKWGVRPTQIVDLLALMGDKVDNIPGVPGIGKKGAAQLLEKYGSLDGIYEHIDELRGKRKSNLIESRDIAYLSRELATIDVAVPLDRTLESLRLATPEPADLNKLFKSLEFYSLLSEEALADVGEDETVETVICLQPDDFHKQLERCSKAEPIAVCPMFEGPSVVNARWVGIAFAQGANTFYVPLEFDRHDTSDDSSDENAKSRLDSLMPLVVSVLGDPSRPKVIHNEKRLRVVMGRRGASLEGVVFDVMLASFLAEPTKIIPHRLSQISRQYLQRMISTDKQLLGQGKTRTSLARLPLETIADHAAQRVRAILESWPKLHAEIVDLELESVLHQVDLPLSRLLAKLELRGIQVAPASLEAMGVEFAARLADYSREIHALAGQEFNIGSPKQLSHILFEVLELPVIKRTKTGYSTNAAVLERLKPKHEIACVLLKHRKLAKLINTYTSVLQAAADPQTNRIHATFQQTVGATGRLITTDPDLQRTPVKTDEGRRIRETFIPKPGCRLISADWSQIELRLLAHFSGDPLLVASFRDSLDVHSRTAAQIFDCDVDQVTRDQRRIGKTVNFATIYGQGATALSQQLGVKRADAKRYINDYFKAYQGVRSWLDQTVSAALEVGYVTTLLGRRRWIPELSSNNMMIRTAGQRIAANTPIQGSAADICKLAMLRIDERMTADGLKTEMLLQIHDELVFEAPNAEVEAASAVIRDVMETVYELAVPLKVDLGVGTSWAEAH